MFYYVSQLIFGVLNPKSGVSTPDNLSNGTELDPGSTTCGATGIALVLSLLTFKFFQMGSIRPANIHINFEPFAFLSWPFICIHHQWKPF